jgi:hypothetical protein
MRFAALLLALALAASPAARAAAPQTAKPASPAGSAEKLPPLSYTCPMHPEILEDKGGTCPICKMDLVPIRLDSVWTCATKPLAVVRDAPGRCPIDGTALVQVTAAVSWTCTGGTEESSSPGTCADGSPKTKTFALRDFYDEFTKPQTLANVKNYKATLMVKDAKTGKETPYSLVRSGRYLQASIGKLPFPAEMYASVKFSPAGKDNRFDFTFPAYSKEPHAVGGPTMTNAAPATTAPLVETLPAATATSAGIDPALVPLPIPDTVPEILAQLTTRTDQIRAFIDKGTFAAIYVPAFQAKDLALALDEHKGELTPERRKVAEPAISKLVRSAYLLDAFGDIGNKQQISEAYAKFLEAEKDIHAAFPQSAGRNPQ